MNINFEVVGRPMGKQRPRVNTITRTAYTPQKTIEYERMVKQAYSLKYKEMFLEEKPIKATIYAIFEIPKAYSKKKRQELSNTPYMHKPDCDNIGKIILDSLNGLAYKDDSQIVEINIKKRYVNMQKFEEEKVIVVLEEMEEK